MKTRISGLWKTLLCLAASVSSIAIEPAHASEAVAPDGGVAPARERIGINDGWRFMKYKSLDAADSLIYDVRPEIENAQDDRPADAEPTEAVEVEAKQAVLKPWVLPTANAFILNASDRHTRPKGNPGSDFPFVQAAFDDGGWQRVDLPHDWAIGGPFMQGWPTAVGGGMGRLPSPGVAWYRRKLDIPATDAGKAIFLDVDGAMSYAIVWINGHLVGGWPFGYASWRVDLTPHLKPGGENQLAIRLDNPPHSSRWYPGGGLYRNVWLTKTSPLHVAQWGVFVKSRDVSAESATLDLEVQVANDSDQEAKVELITRLYELDDSLSRTGGAVASFDAVATAVAPGESQEVTATLQLKAPRLWGPPPTQTPHLYVAETTLMREGRAVDCVETRFGVRDVRFDPNAGIYVNDELIKIRGANQHHDLGALGAAFNVRAAERQLQLLIEMGCNAVRMSHNPPAPELLELTDRMGLLVVNETFDVWQRKKTPLDFHLIFREWSEPDTRALVRRDRNHPSVILWSIGNEVGEQYTGEQGARVARRLHDIVKQEDPTRPTTTAMNFAKPPMPLPAVVDVVSLNYQGEGIRDAPAYKGLQGISTPPLYPTFHEALPEKVILSSENAAAVSSRGMYLFPVFDGVSAPVSDGSGGNSQKQHVSAYELYTTPFGSSADKVLGSLDRHPYVAGGFVWSGWDYLGEPTPYYGARSSYFGVIDLAGFPKDRFYLYQSHWRPDLPLALLLPHWTWPEREGKVTPVHVFTSGDEAELFLNGESLGRKKKGAYEYRLRWDDMIYEPGELRVVAYKHGKQWAEDVVVTTGDPVAIVVQADRTALVADGKDLAFVTARVVDTNGHTCPRATNRLRFSVEGAAELVATDNGDPTCMVAFPAAERPAFGGRCLGIVRTVAGGSGPMEVRVEAEGLEAAVVRLHSE